MMASGKMIKLMEMGFTVILMVQNMKATGLKISNMGKVLKPGPMGLVMKVTMSMARSTVSVDLLGLMVAHILGNLKKTIFKAMVLTIGQMVVSS